MKAVSTPTESESWTTSRPPKTGRGGSASPRRDERRSRFSFSGRPRVTARADGEPESLSEGLHERPDRRSDLPRRVLLHEVAAAHGDLALVGPPPAVLALGAGEDGARLGVDEELSDRARLQPAAVGRHPLDDFPRLAVDGDLARPRQHRPPPLPGFGEGPPVGLHLLRLQPA